MTDLSPYYIDTYEGSAVLDAKRLYADRNAFAGEMELAQRREPVYVWKPKADETIIETNGDTQRPPVIATGTETVLIKKLNPEATALKVYIPSDSKGPLDEKILDQKYEQGQQYYPLSPENDPVLSVVPPDAQLSYRLPKQLPVPVLYETIDRPAVILGARGENDQKHQFLNPGDSLKFEDGECLPLPKAELDTAWRISVLQDRGPQLPPQR